MPIFKDLIKNRFLSRLESESDLSKRSDPKFILRVGSRSGLSPDLAHLNHCSDTGRESMHAV